MYLSYFYKHAEMSIRLGYFWVAMTAADIIAAVAGAGLLRMRGVLGYEGWRWMFLVEVRLSSCSLIPRMHIMLSEEQHDMLRLSRVY